MISILFGLIIASHSIKAIYLTTISCSIKTTSSIKTSYSITTRYSIETSHSNQNHLLKSKAVIQIKSNYSTVTVRSLRTSPDVLLVLDSSAEQVAKDCGVKLMTAFQRRFDPSFSRLQVTSHENG